MRRLREKYMTTTIYICRTCRAHKDLPADHTTPGAELVREAETYLSEHPIQGVEMLSIMCLSQCSNHVTVAFTAPEKFGFIVSNLQPNKDLPAIIEFAQRHAETTDGRVKSVDRPDTIRENLIGKIPPAGWRE